MVVCAGLMAQAPAQHDASAALLKACRFFRENCAHHGGYVWRYSNDLQLSEGEAETTPTMLWVQPPGTPSVGMAFLEAYEATKEPVYLQYAKEAALALAQGQMQSGGWGYGIEFDPDRRKATGYRNNASFKPKSEGRDTDNLTLLDDDVTPSALRLLLNVNKTLGGKEPAITDALSYAIPAIIAAQSPNGGWRHNWDRMQTPASSTEQPILAASYPETWSREWGNDWTAIYYLNDNVAGNILSTLLLAWELTGSASCLEAAKKTGDFMVLAQIPEPQPAWAQQYDVKMHPVWDRKFEPPAISGWESQSTMEALLLLYRKTSDRKYLQPIGPALAYLKKSLLPDGKLARFYELKTNKPLFFVRKGKKYDLVHQANDLPTHYGFIVDSRLEAIGAEYQALLSQGPSAPKPKAPEPDLTAQAQQIITSMDSRGAWIDPRSMKGHNKASPEGVIQSETFVRNVGILCRYLATTPP
jgi:hypothetical protein